MTDDAPAEGLTELLARRYLTTDAARGEKVDRWHAKGRRTARENIADLVDPGSLIEYGRFVTAAQEQRRPLADLIIQTPADGIIGGTASVDGSPCVVLSYDYLVMAGTQGMRGHHKTDRLVQTAERMNAPCVFFTEGGGGRPGDTDVPGVSFLDLNLFALWAAADVPKIAVVSGRCFAGNAVLAGCADLRIATADANIGMGGPAMISGGGLGEFSAEEIGPAKEQHAIGTLDVLVETEAEAVAATQQILGYLRGPSDAFAAPDQTLLRDLLPANEREAFDVRPIIEVLADEDSVTWLRVAWAPELLTAIVRIEGIPVGVIANQSTSLAGAITTDASDKAADFLALCDRWRLPVISLVDTPGFMVGPDTERTGILRQASRMLRAGSRLSTPLIGVVLRRGYGLGAQAMLGGSTHQPIITLAWPDAHLGPMGLEGAVRLGMAKELAALPEDRRESAVAEHTAALRKQAKALNAARVNEIDDVIDPAQTRSIIAATLRRTPTQRPC